MPFPTVSLLGSCRKIRLIPVVLLLTTLILPPAVAGQAACLRGVNIAGAEFGGYTGEYGRKYIYPSDATLNWAASKEMTAIRLPFRWERLQPQLFGAFDADEQRKLEDTVARSVRRGLTVVLDPHNYAEYRGVSLGNGDVTSAAFADFWRKLASLFANDGKVVYMLMNEPKAITAATWFDAAQAAITAIRGTGADNLILIPGTIWTGASHWFDDQEGGSNAEVFQNIRDPSGNFAFEIHQYMDANFSGTNATCPRTGDAILALEAVSGWLRQYGFHGYLGEFGGTSAPDCLDGLAEMAGYINSQNDIWLGWAAWAAGDWWGGYPLSLQPRGGVEKPQMDVLAPFIPGPDGDAAMCTFPEAR